MTHAPKSIGVVLSTDLHMVSEQVAQIDWSSGAMLTATKINFPSINGTACFHTRFSNLSTTLYCA